MYTYISNLPKTKSTQWRVAFNISSFMDKDKITSSFEANRLDEVEALLDGREDAWSLYMLGRVAWKRGRRGEAMSLYARSAAEEPDGPAATALEQARRIMDFYNHDLYNP